MNTTESYCHKEQTNNNNGTVSVSSRLHLNLDTLQIICRFSKLSSLGELWEFVADASTTSIHLWVYTCSVRSCEFVTHIYKLSSHEQSRIWTTVAPSTLWRWRGLGALQMTCHFIMKLCHLAFKCSTTRQ